MTEEFKEYRAYFFGNFYFSSIQQGIQAAHVTSTMALALERETFGEKTPAAKAVYYNWAMSPTKILLSGGGTPFMNKYKYLVQTLGSELGLPFAWFHEPDADNCMSSIGIIVPDDIFNQNLSPERVTGLFGKVLTLDDIVAEVQDGDIEGWAQTLLYLTLRTASLAR